ncbi:hypothetical protein [Nocardioides sp.]|uniref:hypothetical protein n=1 Tax=Nocardioides sp. TaxID=35761 RepID=UPI003566D45A
MTDFEDPLQGGEDAALPHRPPPSGAASAEDELLERHRADLLTVPGVTAVWSGLTSTGAVAVFVGVTDPSARDRLPRSLEGLPVEVVDVPGGFVALADGDRPAEPPPSECQ